MNKKIAIVVDRNDALPYLAPLVDGFMLAQYEVYLLANNSSKQGGKSFLIPGQDRQHVEKLRPVSLAWYKDNTELAAKLASLSPFCVFCLEADPFIYQPELFRTRDYKIFSLTHSVDNHHVKAIESGCIDNTIVPFAKYGEYLNWDKANYVVLGTPKYDIVDKLDAVAILQKYKLPKKYILLFAPNNNLLRLPLLLRIVLQVWLHGYKLIIKGKVPKCHRNMYRYISRYFLSQDSFYPFITHELICASSGVIAFDSTVVEEVLMFKKPLVNFWVKDYRGERQETGNFQMLKYMWQADFCLDIKLVENGAIQSHKSLPLFMRHFRRRDIDYEKIQLATFFVPGRVAERIVSFVKRVQS